MSHVTWPIVMHCFAKCSTETPYFDNVLDAQLLNYTLIVVTQENILCEHYWVKLGHLSLSLRQAHSQTKYARHNLL